MPLSGRILNIAQERNLGKAWSVYNNRYVIKPRIKGAVGKDYIYINSVNIKYEFRNLLVEKPPISKTTYKHRVRELKTSYYDRVLNLRQEIRAQVVWVPAYHYYIFKVRALEERHFGLIYDPQFNIYRFAYYEIEKYRYPFSIIEVY